MTASPVPLTVEAVPCPAVGPSPSLRCDKEVLLAVRDRLRGEHRELLRSWRPDNAVQAFEGITVGSGDGGERVVGLKWIGWWADPQVRLVGAIPPELGRLSELAVLDLAGNGLTGSIPAELGQLARLRELYLNANRLTGPIPAELGQLAQLQYLRLNHNQLTGPLPPELGQLAALWALYLHANALTGPIPVELEQRAARHTLLLHLDADEEMWRVPEEWGQSEPCPAVGPSPNLRCDKEILLAVRDRLRGKNQAMLRTWHPDNGIYNFQGVVISSGDYPPPPRVDGLEVIGWWSDPQFRLVGSLPPELGRLPELGHVVLRENGLRGPIPAEWGQLTRLWLLDLAGNALTDAVPPALGRLAHMERLDLGGNQLTGPIPAELGQLEQLQALNLNHNRLTGPIPPELGQLAHLRVLKLGGNSLTGCIPPTLVPVCECPAPPRCE
ncbi:MAG: hypothetical protein OXG36_09310 [Caldilineaceae bacterium]|nr:hypothetical protein [Caldilineaceae bacterium]